MSEEAKLPGKTTIIEKDEHFLWVDQVRCRDCGQEAMPTPHPYAGFTYRCVNADCWLSA